MRASVRNCLLVASLNLALVQGASAQQGIYLPPAPQGPGGEDSVETSSGSRCRQSINSNSGYFDVGVAAGARSEIPTGARDPVNPFPNGVLITINDRDREAIAYARVTVPLGKQPKRIDCSRMYELEIERLKQEITLLKMNAE